MLVKQIKDDVDEADEADELKESEEVKRKIQLVVLVDQVLNGEVCAACAVDTMNILALCY